ncbi:MAG: CCA tRNA nucleotidyltransferase [Solirubrobacterales bacterium]|nr:CCA tRNA nucleotidyltransferase [Solirubrobacterales bacterium]
MPSAEALLEGLAALPAGRPLLAALQDADGVYLVGGAVRDLLLGGEPLDLDLVSEDDPAELAARLGGSIRAHDRFGTSRVTVGGFSYDLARARSESYSRPGALPEVAPASIAQDLERRDFTVNALAIALGGPRRGELVTVSHALEDLDARRLRVLHRASFIDDPIRLLRLARYASRLRFAIERDTAELARIAVAGGAIGTVSGSRVGSELRLLATEPDPVSAFGQLAELELDTAIDRRFHLGDPELARAALSLLPSDGRADLLTLAIAARRIEASELRALLDALAFEAADRELIVTIARRSEALSESLASADDPSQIAEAARDAPPEAVALAGALGPARAAGQWLERLRHVRLEIGGDDLLAAGVPAGPAIGRGLRAALAAKLDGRASGREAELAAAVAGAEPGRQGDEPGA